MTEISPTVHPQVVTYQYCPTVMPRYRPAIVLGAVEPTVSHGAVLFSGAPFRSEGEMPMQPSGFAQHFLDDAEYDWTKPEAGELHEIMLRVYDTESRASLILGKSGIESTAIHFNQSPHDFWKQALEVTARAGRSRKLVQCALADPSIAGVSRLADVPVVERGVKSSPAVRPCTSAGASSASVFNPTLGGDTSRLP